MATRSGLFLNIRIAVSVIGILLGIPAFFVFLCYYSNKHAGVWALVSAIFSAVCLHLHILHKFYQFRNWYSTEVLSGLRFLGVLVCSVGLAGMTWYIFSALYYHKSFYPLKESDYLSAIWAFMTAKWGFSLFMSCWHYEKVTETESPLIIKKEDMTGDEWMLSRGGEGLA